VFAKAAQNPHPMTRFTSSIRISSSKRSETILYESAASMADAYMESGALADHCYGEYDELMKSHSNPSL